MDVRRNGDCVTVDAIRTGYERRSNMLCVNLLCE